MADSEAEKKKQQKALIRNRYKEFLPKGADPSKVYRQWTNAIFGSNQPDDAVMYFILTTAKAAGIDPRVPRQIYAVPYNTYNKESGQWEQRYNTIVGIEGMVTIAENSKAYGGTTKPEYEFEEDDNGKPDHKKPINCTVGVYKVVQGLQNISYQTVYFDEYYTPGKEKNGKYIPTMWDNKPLTMLKKVALAHALRATFTACAGLYIEEELERNVIEGEVVGDNSGSKIKPTPDIQAKIEACTTAEEIQAVYDSLPPTDKMRAQPFIEQKMSEL